MNVQNERGELFAERETDLRLRNVHLRMRVGVVRNGPNRQTFPSERPRKAPVVQNLQNARPLQFQPFQPTHVKQFCNGRPSCRLSFRSQGVRRGGQSADLLLFRHHKSFRGHLAPPDNPLVREQDSRSVDTLLHGVIPKRVPRLENGRWGIS